MSYLTDTKNLNLQGGFVVDMTATATTSITLPTSGTLATTAQVPSLPISVTNGGTGLSSTTENQLLYSSASNTIAGLSSANNGTLITSGAGVPSISSTLPSAVQGNITSTGTLSSVLKTSNGRIAKITAISDTDSPYTVLSSDHIISVSPSLGAVSVVLPAASSGNKGQIVFVKDVLGNASINNITVTVSGGGNINNDTSVVINTDNGGYAFYSDVTSTGWFVLSST